MEKSEEQSRCQCKDYNLGILTLVWIHWIVGGFPATARIHAPAWRENDLRLI